MPIDVPVNRNEFEDTNFFRSCDFSGRARFANEQRLKQHQVEIHWRRVGKEKKLERVKWTNWEKKKKKKKRKVVRNKKDAEVVNENET